jgi:hypothetical protein
MMWRHLSVIAVSCGFLISCDESNPSQPTQPVNSSFTLAPGESALVQGQGALTLRFLRVVQDNRCPGDATCITAGEAVLAFEAVQGPSLPVTTPLELKTTPSGQVGMVNAYRVELVSVAPYPFASKGPIQAAEYRATLHVTTNQ